MGLKEKALKFERELHSAVSGAADTVDSYSSEIPERDTREPEEILAEKKSDEGQKTDPPNHYGQKEGGDLFLSSDDLHSSTRPVLHGLAQQGQIEALLSLIELSKELSSARSENEVWDTILFTLIGQLGVREVATFFREKDNFVLKANRGFVMEVGFEIPLDSSLIKELSQETGLVYIKKLVPHLKHPEKVWINALNADVLVPVLNYDKIVGFIILGKTIAHLDYNLEDLMYLKILGELFGSFHHSTKQLIQISRQKKQWEERESDYKVWKYYIEAIQKATNFVDIDQAFQEVLHSRYKVNKFVFLLREGRYFLPNLHKNLDEKSVKKLETSIHESWIIEMKNKKSWYEYTNYLEDTKFTKKFSSEDISLIHNVLVKPLYSSGEIEGIFMIFAMNKKLSSENLEYLGQIINLYYWAFMSFKNKTADVRNIEDPLFALRTLLNDHEVDLKTKEVPYIALYITIENSNHLTRIKGNRFFDKQRYYLKSTLNSMVSEQDNCMEVFPAKFLLISRGKTKEDGEQIFSRLKESLRLKYKLEKFRPLVRYKILSRPHDPLVSIDSFLFD